MQRWPSLKQLQYLVALDEHKNFNRAAKACHVSQSTLSTGIQTLEDMMNLQLVERDHKSFIMTPVGMEIVARARNLLLAGNSVAAVACACGFNDQAHFARVFSRWQGLAPSRWRSAQQLDG